MIWNSSKLSASHLSRATAIFVVDCCEFGPSWIFWIKMELMTCAGLVGGTTEQIFIFTDLIWYYQWYETLTNCLYHTSAVTQPFLLVIAANLALAGFMGWNWSLWPVRTWLAVQRSKYVFFMTLHVTIYDMKYCITVCILPQPCHSHFWLLVAANLALARFFGAENGAYGLCRLGWRYNGSKLSFYWPHMLVPMIWSTS